MITVFSKASLPMEKGVGRIHCQSRGRGHKKISGGFAPRPPQVLRCFLAPPIENVLRGPPSAGITEQSKHSLHGIEFCSPDCSCCKLGCILQCAPCWLTTIYTGTGYAMFGVAFFAAENKF